MKAYTANIEAQAEENKAFRRVLYTGRNMQLVVMSLKPGEEIGDEVHTTHDQFFRIEDGTGVVDIEGVRTELSDDSVVIVPAGTRHNVVNTSHHKDLKLYTIYAPPQHLDGTVHETKSEADRAEMVVI